MAAFIAPAHASPLLTFSLFSDTLSTGTALSTTNSLQLGIANSVSNTTTTLTETFSQVVITPVHDLILLFKKSLNCNINCSNIRQ
jgi:hypothetical protein